MATAVAGTRSLLAFYGSTPAYRPVLDAHGWGDLQPELNTLSKQGRWDEMGGLIDDEMLDTLAVRGEPGRHRRRDPPSASAPSPTGSGSTCPTPSTPAAIVEVRAGFG